MKKTELLARLQIYRKEIYRRAFVLLLAGFLPVIVVFLGIGLEYNIINYGFWAAISYFALFLLLTLGLICWFSYMVSKGIPKKIGLLCPECKAPIVKNDVEKFMQTGVCGFCGAKILDD